MFNNKNEIVIKGKPLTKIEFCAFVYIYKLTQREMKGARLSSSSFFFFFLFFLFFLLLLFLLFFVFFSGFSLFKVVQP